MISINDSQFLVYISESLLFISGPYIIKENIWIKISEPILLT